MRPFSIVFLALSFLISTLCRVLVPASSNSSAVNTKFGSLEIPVIPSHALANIHVDWYDERIIAAFDSAQMYYNIHAYLVNFWKHPYIEPITRVQDYQSYPSLVTWIMPAPGSNLLTTVVAASVLSGFLEKIPTLDWRHPNRLAARLTTRTQPPQPIGNIGCDYLPELDSSTNYTSGTNSGICRDRWVDVSRDIKLRLEFDGQSPSKPLITSAVWLQSLTGISSSIFAYHAPQEVLGIDWRRRIFYFRQASTPQWILESHIDVSQVPQGKEPLNLGELVQGLTEMLNQVALGRCFEQMRAVISKDGWDAATYQLTYRSGERNTDTA